MAIPDFPFSSSPVPSDRAAGKLARAVRGRLTIHAGVVVSFETQVHHARQVDSLIDFQLIRPDREVKLDRGDARNFEFPSAGAGLGDIYDQAPVRQAMSVEERLKSGTAARFLLSRQTA